MVYEKKNILFEEEKTKLLNKRLFVGIKTEINPLTPNDPYMGRTALLTSICCILYIYSTNIRTEYFKHAA